MDQEALYAWCHRVNNEREPMERQSGAAMSFHRASPSYLVATEYPWLVLAEDEIRGRRVLTVAAAGELPLFFLAAGAARVTAVDISFSACAMNELKRSVLANETHSSFVRFFLAGIDSCSSWLETLEPGRKTGVGPQQRQRVYRRYRQRLSRPARAYWDRRILGTSEAANPFLDLVRPTDFSCLHHIPWLADGDAYQAWQRAATGYPLLNLPLDQCLAHLDQRFDLIYCSNTFEYLRSDSLLEDRFAAYITRLKTMAKLAWFHLTPGGRLVHYLFARRDSSYCRDFTAEFQTVATGFSLRTRPVQCVSPLLPGARFRHTVAIFEKVS